MPPACECSKLMRGGNPRPERLNGTGKIGLQQKRWVMLSSSDGSMWGISSSPIMASPGCFQDVLFDLTKGSMMVNVGHPIACNSRYSTRNRFLRRTPYKVQCRSMIHDSPQKSVHRSTQNAPAVALGKDSSCDPGRGSSCEQGFWAFDLIIGCFCGWCPDPRVPLSSQYIDARLHCPIAFKDHWKHGWPGLVVQNS